MTHYRGYKGNITQTYRKLHGYKTLLAWQAADELAVLVHSIVTRFEPRYYKLTNQMLGSASSVKANIAEGYCFLEKLIKGLRTKRKEGTWDRSMGVKEETPDYIAEDADVPFTLPDS